MHSLRCHCLSSPASLGIQNVVVYASSRSALWTGLLQSLLVDLVINFRLLYALFDAREKLTRAIGNQSEEFAATQTVISDRHSVVPDANDNHDVANVHLLEHGEEFVTGAVLTIVVETFSQHLLLLNRVNLTDTIGQDSILGRGKLG